MGPMTSDTFWPLAVATVCTFLIVVIVLIVALFGG